ncbi:MAG: hypothetical protein M0T83_09915 [Nitrospiraceae bacterium]|nr:hypothetical protein [Nitrospiraceae bacterium]
MKDKLVEKISEVAERGRDLHLLEYTMDSLLSGWKKANDNEIPMSDYVVIRLVTLLEVQIRQTIREMIDHGNPYRINGTRIIKKWSQETLIDSMLAIKDDRITFGGLVAHGVSVNTIDEILSNLEAVFGESFKSELAASTVRWTEDVERGDDLKPLIENLGKTIEWIKKLLTVRHIVVHKIPKKRPYSEEEIPEFVLHAKQFATALEWLVVAKRWGNAPRTQGMMNRMASKRSKEAQMKLDELRGGTEKNFCDPKSAKEEIEFHWDRFVDLSAKSEAGYLEGRGGHGSMAPMLYAQAKERLTKIRIKEIERFFEWNSIMERE